jgi:hypothetical protein
MEAKQVDVVQQIEEIVSEHFETYANPHDTLYRISLVLKLNKPLHSIPLQPLIIG